MQHTHTQVTNTHTEPLHWPPIINISWVWKRTKSLEQTHYQSTKYTQRFKCWHFEWLFDFVLFIFFRNFISFINLLERKKSVKILGVLFQKNLPLNFAVSYLLFLVTNSVTAGQYLFLFRFSISVSIIMPLAHGTKRKKRKKITSKEKRRRRKKARWRGANVNWPITIFGSFYVTHMHTFRRMTSTHVRRMLYMKQTHSSTCACGYIIYRCARVWECVCDLQNQEHTIHNVTSTVWSHTISFK